MLLSLAAGGVGLNLVGANHLFMLDMHWNPQMESQACDRIYRWKVALSWPVMGTVLQEAEAPFLERLPKLFQLWASNFRYCDASF